LVEDNVVKGVKFDHRGTIHTISSKYVIAACDAETLFEKMLPQKSVPTKMKERLKGAPLYASALTVALGIDCPAEELGLGEEIVFLADPSVSRHDLGQGDPHLSGIHILASTVRDKSLSLPEHGTITLFIPAWMENNHFWGCEIDEKGDYIRGDEYNRIKDEYANILIDRVEEKLIPNLRKHILYCDVATPITHFRYTGNKNGTMMAQKPGKENYQGKVASYITPVQNLFLSGHWADLGGGIPIAIKSSINTTLLVLQKEDKKRFKLLANYMDGKIGVDQLRNSDLLVNYNNSWIKDPTPAQKKVKRREDGMNTDLIP
jgi:phytoene dehydrogenase-like protein